MEIIRIESGCRVVFENGLQPCYDFYDVDIEISDHELISEPFIMHDYGFMDVCMGFHKFKHDNAVFLIGERDWHLCVENHVDDFDNGTNSD